MINNIPPPNLSPDSGSASTSNEELIRRCLDGDERAWEQLVSKYERLVYSIPLKEGLRVADAAEITQDAFVALVKDLPIIRRPELLAFWLMTTTRRLTWRAKARSDYEEPDCNSETFERTVQDWSERQAEIAWIYELLQSIGEPCRSLIRDLYLNPTEPSYAEIAVRIGRPVGSIGPMRARCLSRFRGLVEGSVAGV